MVSNQSFDKSRRLLNAFHFKTVFDQTEKKVFSAQIFCLSKKNALDCPRLGLVIAKKNIRQAVQRNRIKRIIRESFRLHQDQLPCVDIVVLAKKNLDSLDNPSLHKEVADLWQRLAKKYNQQA